MLSNKIFHMLPKKISYIKICGAVRFHLKTKIKVAWSKEIN
jgi:hypothetical protein